MRELIILTLAALVTPLAYPLMAGERVFIGYLVTSFLPVIYLTLKACGWQWSFDALWEACFPKSLWNHPSTKLDFRYFFINTACFTTLIVPFISLGTLAAHETRTLLESFLGANQSPLTVTPLAVILVTLTIALLSDFALYLAHYLQHKIPFLWEFHKVHHSAAVLTPIAVYRMHPVDDLLAIGLGSILMGAGMGVFHYLFGRQPDMVIIAGLNVVTFVFYLVFYNLRHSQFWLHYPGIWGVLFISPAQHQIHHSSLKRHWDKNFGFIFGFWDWLFGTLYNPKEKEKLVLGIGEETAEYNSVSALYLLPFRKNWARWTRRNNIFKNQA